MGYSDNFTLLKELLFGVLINKDEYLIVGKLGGGFTNNQRSSFVEDLKNLKVESNLIEPSGSKIPFTFIKPALVVEVESVDIINSASNQIIKKPVIKFEENKFSKTGNKPSVSLISPVFKGFRDDKKIDFDQVGLVQIKRIIELNDEIIEAPNKSKTKVLKKEGNNLFKISKRFSNELLRKKVYREKPIINLPKEFIEAFRTKMKEVEDHFLENTEMYLFQKKLTLRWIIFKALIFLPFMFFLSGLIQEITSILF